MNVPRGEPGRIGDYEMNTNTLPRVRERVGDGVSAQVRAWEHERAMLTDRIRFLEKRAISEGQPGKDLSKWALTWREIHRLEAQRDVLNALLARSRSLT